MKKLLAILLGVMCMAAFSGCKDSESIDVDPELRIYTLNFVFVDKDGNNLVDNVEAYPHNSGNIDPYAYKMTQTLGDVTMSTPKYDLLCLGESENAPFLGWSAVTTNRPLLSKIEMTLSFKQLFGNSDTHTIISEWQEPDLNNGPECSKVMFDGQYYPVVYNKDMRCFLVTITVDNKE